MRHDGKAVKAAAYRKGITQEEMAGALGYKRSWLLRLYDRMLWDDATLQKALKKLKISKAELEGEYADAGMAAGEPQPVYKSLMEQKDEMLALLKKENELKTRIIEKWIEKE